MRTQVKPATLRTTALLSLAIPDVVLALDMSLAHTGYALIRLATGEVRKGVIEPNGPKGMARLAFLRERIVNLAKYGVTDLPVPPPRSRQDGLQFLPVLQASSCLVLIEGYAFGAKGQAVISLGELGGVIRLALTDAGIRYLEIPPTQLKRFATGKGNSPKQIMLMEIFDRWGEKHYDDNIADAFALMQLGLALIGRPTKPLLKFQAQVVSDVLRTCLKDHPEEAAA